MLNRLRQSVAGPMAKVLIGLLVVSFALWGIGDVFGQRSDPPIAEIGSEDIPVSRFQLIFTQSFNQLRQNLRQRGGDITIEQAREAGFDRRVLGEMIDRATIDQEAEKLGLTISDEEIITQIFDDEAFQGAFGGFDRLMFENQLRAIGLSEEDYLHQRRQDLIRRQLVTIFTARPPAPKALDRENLCGAKSAPPR